MILCSSIVHAGTRSSRVRRRGPHPFWGPTAHGVGRQRGEQEREREQEREEDDEGDVWAGVASSRAAPDPDLWRPPGEPGGPPRGLRGPYNLQEAPAIVDPRSSITVGTTQQAGGEDLPWGSFFHPGFFSDDPRARKRPLKAETCLPVLRHASIQPQSIPPALWA